MLIPFRQGIFRLQQSPRFLNFNEGDIDLNANSEPVIVTIADGVTDYLYTELSSVSKAWKGPFLSRQSYWLYWDIDTVTAVRTFRSTTVKPDFGPILPANPSKDQHFFDTTKKQMFVFNGKTWDRKLRLFAGEITEGKLNPYSNGPQTKVYQQNDAGEIIYDENDLPIIRPNGKFLTTSISVKSSDNTDNDYKITSTNIRARSNENIPAFHGVTWVGPSILGLAQQTDPRKGACVGISTYDILRDDVNTFVTHGFLVNEAWDFNASPGTLLFLGENGEITTTVPSFISSQVVGNVINRNTALIDIREQIIIDGPVVTATPTPVNTS